ncbi:ParB/RepB/Spo0J family partition protein [Candidatus Kurthia intestinigallinarum]|uniref:ParB/RepB/Spo0J family partition protein n=1 Tax=Candidatus Kurthia intestinigallinarum TaxID=1562256 RepID=UPI000F8E09F4
MKGGIIVEETFIDVADGDIVENIAVRKIRPNPFQPRRIFNEEALEELSQSIKEHGILQPIILRKTGNFYEIVAGERRFRATKKALIPEIPAVVRNYNDREMMELATLENLQREDLTPIEEAESYRKLMDALNMTQEVLAERLGKSRSYIANHVRLLTLPEDIQKMVDRGELSMGHGRALIGIKRKNIIPIVAKKVIDQQMNVRQLESYVHALNKDVSRVTKKKSVKNLYLDEAAAELRDYLGTSVSIKSSKNKGKIEIDFFSDEDLERIINLLKERGE